MPLSYFSLLIVIETDDFGFRDETMCEYIKNKSKEQELDKVVISCGQDHLYPIEEDLEDDGWKVKSYDSAWAWISPSYWKRKLIK